MPCGRWFLFIPWYPYCIRSPDNFDEENNQLCLWLSSCALQTILEDCLHPRHFVYQVLGVYKVLSVRLGTSSLDFVSASPGVMSTIQYAMPSSGPGTGGLGMVNHPSPLVAPTPIQQLPSLAGHPHNFLTHSHSPSHPNPPHTSFSIENILGQNRAANIQNITSLSLATHPTTPTRPTPTFPGHSFGPSPYGQPQHPTGAYYDPAALPGGLAASAPLAYSTTGFTSPTALYPYSRNDYPHSFLDRVDHFSKGKEYTTENIYLSSGR